MMARLLSSVPLLFVLSWLPGTASAATECNAVATDLAFGTTTGTGDVDSSATVAIQCNSFGLLTTGTVRVRMCLSIEGGVNGGGLISPRRRMTNAFGDILQFQIYSDPGRSQIWGSRTGTPAPRLLDLAYGALLSGSGSTQATMYGRVFAQGGLAAGNYGNPFTGSHTRLDYRFSEPLLFLPNPYPDSCVSGGAGGGAVTFPFAATATVPNNCIISTATNLDFGSLPGLITADRDQTSAITFTCTGRTAWNVGLDDGQNSSGGIRRMRLGATGSYVNYELYRNAARTQRWGATIGTDTVPGTGTGSAQTLTVYGRVPAAQAVPAGSYLDVVTVTVTY